jgi:diguanylate cyclase (GGDEF)-like protein
MLEKTRSESSFLDERLGRLLPRKLREDDLRVRPRALLLLRFTVLGAIFTTLLAPYFVLFLRRPDMAFFNVVYAASLLLTPVVLRRTGSVSAAAHWALGSALSLLVAESVTLGGVEGSAYPWISVIPIGGMLLCGLRGGFVWGILASVSLAAIGAAHGLGLVANAPQVGINQLIETTLSATSLCLALTALGWLSESRASELVDYLERERSRFRDLSLRDPLTGLANRALLMETLRRSRERSRRSQVQGALFFIDMDGFKKINDRFGHAAGDKVLQTIGKRLERSLRASDVAARIGGDEFALVIESLDSRVAIARVAEKVARAVEHPVPIAEEEVRVGVSIGIVSYPDDEDPAAGRRSTPNDPFEHEVIGDGPQTHDTNALDQAACERLLKKADAAMYQAKRAGHIYRIHGLTS